MITCKHCKKNYDTVRPTSLVMHECSAGGYCEAEEVPQAPITTAVSSVAASEVPAVVFGDDDDDEFDDGHLWLAPRPHGQAFRARPELREALVSFGYASPDYAGSRILQSQPQRPFKPRGLMLFDVPPRMQVSATLIGNSEQVIMSCGDVPARWFATAQSFEQLKEKLRQGLEPAAWGSWDVVQPGLTIRLHFSHAVGAMQAVMWGHCTW